MRILAEFNNIHYLVWHISSRNREGGFVISGFPTKKFEDIHITFVSNGHHHITFANNKTGASAKLFNNNLYMSYKGKTIKEPIGKDGLREFLHLGEKTKKTDDLSAMIVPKQLTLFEIINGTDWTYGPLMITNNGIEKGIAVQKLRKNDVIVKAPCALKLVLSSRKYKLWHKIFSDIPYLYLVK